MITNAWKVNQNADRFWHAFPHIIFFDYIPVCEQRPIIWDSETTLNNIILKNISLLYSHCHIVSLLICIKLRFSQHYQIAVLTYYDSNCHFSWKLKWVICILGSIAFDHNLTTTDYSPLLMNYSNKCFFLMQCGSSNEAIRFRSDHPINLCDRRAALPS